MVALIGYIGALATPNCFFSLPSLISSHVSSDVYSGVSGICRSMAAAPSSTGQYVQCESEWGTTTNSPLHVSMTPGILRLILTCTIHVYGRDWGLPSLCHVPQCPTVHLHIHSARIPKREKDMHLHRGEICKFLLPRLSTERHTPKKAHLTHASSFGISW